MTDQLKSRYQKLVSLFPPGHRAVYADDMVTTMYDAPGMGLAAPQVGVEKRLFVYDVGEGPQAIVNPVIVRGQVEGGAVQGIGQALCEKLSYDADSGQLLSASYMDYAMPRADGFTGFKTAFDQSVPCLTNALGAKGVGELGTIGATPATMNAVADALAAEGVRNASDIPMPATSERVWQALHARA